MGDGAARAPAMGRVRGAPAQARRVLGHEQRARGDRHAAIVTTEWSSPAADQRAARATVAGRP
jgi:hypothetical protein